MTDKEVIEQLRFEYRAICAANPNWLAKFYDFLLQRGFNRYQLSAYGISKDEEA